MSEKFVAFDDASHPVPTTESDESGQGWFIWFCLEHGLNCAAAQEIIADVANHLGATGSTDIDKSRELLLRIAAALSWLIEYDGDMKLAARVMALTLGFRDLAGAPDGEETTLAAAASTDKHLVSKQTVNKCKKSLKAYLDSMPQFAALPTAPGERSAEARRKMSEVTRKKWRAEK